MGNKPFSQQGEIFSSSKPTRGFRLPKINYKPSGRMKTIGIVSVVAATTFSLGLLIPSERAEAIAQQAQQAVAPVNNQLPNQLQPILLASSEPQESQAQTHRQPPVDPRQAGQDIIGLQQQINNQMGACIQNTAQAQAAVNQLRAREAQLEAQRADLNRRIDGIDTSTPAGRDARRQLQSQRDRVEDERTIVRRGISNVREQHNDIRSDCRRRINDLRSLKRRAEVAQQRGFTNATDLDTSRRNTNTNESN